MTTILVVDDEEPILRMVGDLLQEEGYTTLRAYHGAQALELVQNVPPDLVLTDLMMPIMGGAELCRRLKDDPATRDVPVIAMSAAGRVRAEDHGADDFIGKPFDLEALLALVARYVGRGSGEPRVESRG